MSTILLGVSRVIKRDGRVVDFNVKQPADFCIAVELLEVMTKSCR